MNHLALRGQHRAAFLVDLGMGAVATRRFRALVASLAMLVGACSHNPPAPPKNYPPIQKIAIVPVLEPAGYTVENRNAVAALGGIPALIGMNAIKNAKAGQFTAAMLKQHPKPGAKLLARLVDDLTRQGYQVEVLDNLSRGDDDPDEIDYATLKTSADAVLHIRFTGTGVLSTTFDMSYVPRLNVRGILYAPNRDDFVYEEDLSYGVDARAGRRSEVVADAKYAYRDFDTLLVGVPDLAFAFESGSEALGGRIAQHIKETVK